MHAVVADAAEPPLAGPASGAEPFAPHDDGAEAEPLNLEAEALLHVVVLDDVDLVGDPGVLERPGEVLGLGRGEGGEVVLHPDGGGLGVVAAVGGRVRVERRDGEVGAAPVRAVEDGGGADVEEDDGVPGAEVVVDGPAHGVRRLVGEVDGDGEAAKKTPGDSGCSDAGGGGRGVGAFTGGRSTEGLAGACISVGVAGSSAARWSGSLWLVADAAAALLAWWGTGREREGRRYWKKWKTWRKSQAEFEVKRINLSRAALDVSITRGRWTRASFWTGLRSNGWYWLSVL
ncbi:hypothetical protein PR202_gb21189 [Eleusine coracana subsp. coracana]|uniref:Uncharacterized protein n=1 Tax=Eleusine coracana subsp. coracana TaxID=191504 RepID=A0AAV5FAK0_ELECO|nr:hypothetical protein PR202_gb21189 [Eleusine coracana subsp. coracana]